MPVLSETELLIGVQPQDERTSNMYIISKSKYKSGRRPRNSAAASEVVRAVDRVTGAPTPDSEWQLDIPAWIIQHGTLPRIAPDYVN